MCLEMDEVVIIGEEVLRRELGLRLGHCVVGSNFLSGDKPVPQDMYFPNPTVFPCWSLCASGDLTEEQRCFRQNLVRLALSPLSPSPSISLPLPPSSEDQEDTTQTASTIPISNP